MSRPITLFTGQWADLTLEDVAKKASAWGFDGLNWRAGETILKWTKPWQVTTTFKSRWDILE